MPEGKRAAARKRRKRAQQKRIAILAVLLVAIVGIAFLIRGCINKNKAEEDPGKKDPEQQQEDPIHVEPTPEELRRQKLADFVVWVDAGHGYSDGGCTSKYTDLAEKEVDLMYALSLQKKLEEMGFTVYMTRTDDTPPDWLEPNSNGNYLWTAKKRPDTINTKDVDISISLHCNSSDYAPASGTWICYDMLKDKDWRLSQEPDHPHLKEEWNTLMTELRTRVKDCLSLAMPDRKIMYSDGSDLALCRSVNAPAILLECGFLTGKDECALILDETWQNTYLTAVADGVMSYFNWLYPEN